MNTKLPLIYAQTRKLMAPAIASAIAIAAFSPLAAAQSKQHEQALTVVAAAEVDDKNANKSEVIEIRIENGKAIVRRNGQEIPSDQIKNENGHIVIVDEDGEAKIIEVTVNDDRGTTSHAYATILEKLATNRADAAVEAPKVMIGVHMGEPDEALRYHLGLEPDAATLVLGVYEDLPAHEAGIRQHDVIVAVNGKAPANAKTIREVLSKANPGDTVEFRVIQAGHENTISVELAPYDRKAMDEATLIGKTPEVQDLWSALHDWPKQGHFEFHLGGGSPRVFVAPGEGVMESRFRPLLERMMAPGQKGGVEQQLNRLDQRMAELEKMLQKLIEQRSQTR